MTDEEKLDQILDEIKQLREKVDKYHSVEVKDALASLYQSATTAQEELELPHLSTISSYLFDMVQSAPTSGVYLASSVIRAGDRQLWFLTANYLERLQQLSPDEVMEKRLSAIGSTTRVTILQHLSVGELGFSQLNEQMHLLDGALNHHLKLLLEADFIIKSNRRYQLTSHGLQALLFAKSIRIDPVLVKEDNQRPTVDSPKNQPK